MSLHSPPNSPSSTSSVQVVVRLRPLNEKEKKHGTLPVVSASTADKTVTLLKGTGSRQTKTSYKFDNVFTAFSTQEEVFEATLKPVIRDVLLGYESTVFAYGQTGTGKTHTMEGDLNDVNLFGVIPRSAAAIFETLKGDPEYVSSSVYCSFLEIYNEELCDLLVPAGTNLPTTSSSNNNASTYKGAKLAIMEGKNGPFCRGLSECCVESAQDLLVLMQKAQQQRQVGETNMNKQSSRSHCIFTLRVESKRQLADGSILEVGGKLHCVDLAGSECAKSADMGGGTDPQQAAARERERMNINRSLLTLGRVVSALKEQSQQCSSMKKATSVRIPYRDSKLTRILQESLGGRCKTCLIATMSPSVTAIEESMSTLNYAQAANGIINKPVTTSFMTAGSTMGHSSNNKLPVSNDAAGSVEHWEELECRLQYMQSQVEEAQQALARKHIQQQELIERAEEAEMGRKSAERNLHVAEQQIEHLKTKVDDTVQQLETSQQALKETTLVLEATQQTELALTNEAETLLAILKDSISDGDRLHQKLVLNRQEVQDQKAATREFHREQMELLRDVLSELTSIATLQTAHRESLEKLSEDHNREQLDLLDVHMCIVERMKNECVEQTRELRGAIHNGMLPALQLQTAKIREGLKDLEEARVAGDKELLGHCLGISDRLSASASHTKHLEDQCQSRTQLLDETIKSHLVDAKEKISNTVDRLSQALEQAKGARNQRRQDMMTILSKWNEMRDLSSHRVESICKDHVDRMESSVRSMYSEESRRKQISEAIVKQNEFVQQKRTHHMRELERQNAFMKQQLNSITVTKSRQDQLNASMIANIMKGVQDLVKKEMNAVTVFQEENFGVLVKDCQEMTCRNKDIQKATSESYSHFESDICNLGGWIEKNFQSQVDVASSLSQGVTGFGDSIRSALGNQSNEANQFANQFMKTLEDHGLEDDSSSNLAAKTMEVDLKNQSHQLFSGIQDSANHSIMALKESSNQAFTYMKHDVIENTKRDIENNIKSSQAKSASNLQRVTEEVNATIALSDAAIIDEVNKELEIAMLMKKCIEVAASESFTKSIENHKALICNAEWLATSLARHEEAVLGKISKSSGILTTSTEQVDVLSCEVIRIQDETPTIEDRNKPIFDENLSKTPLPDEILKNAFVEILDDSLHSDVIAGGKENSLPNGESVEINDYSKDSRGLHRLEKSSRSNNTRTEEASSSAVLSKRPSDSKSNDGNILGNKKPRVHIGK